MLVSHASHGLHPFSITASPALRVVMLLESNHIETSSHWQSRPFYVGPVWVVRLCPTLPQGRACKFQTELGLDLNLWPSYCEATVLTAAPLCPTHHTKKNSVQQFHTTLKSFGRLTVFSTFCSEERHFSQKSSIHLLLLDVLTDISESHTIHKTSCNDNILPQVAQTQPICFQKSRV